MMLSFAAHWKLDIPLMTTLFWTSQLCISMPSGKHYSLLPASLSNGANQTNNKSICNCNHTDFLPSAIISMVYLLTEPFLKAEASRGLCSLGRLLMSLCCSGERLSPLTLLFIWKSLVLSNLGHIHALQTQNQISDLIISQKSIKQQSVFCFFSGWLTNREDTWKVTHLYLKNNHAGWQSALKKPPITKRSHTESLQQPCGLFKGSMNDTLNP